MITSTENPTKDLVRAVLLALYQGSLERSEAQSILEIIWSEVPAGALEDLIGHMQAHAALETDPRHALEQLEVSWAPGHALEVAAAEADMHDARFERELDALVENGEWR